MTLRLVPALACALVLGLLPTSLAAQHLRPRDVDALPAKPADARIRYAPGDPLQFGDLRLPRARGPHPVAIVIHGGCWVSSFASLQNSTALADALRDAGVATWNVEYRRLDHPGGGWPGTFADVAAAADHLPALAAQHDLDLSRVVAVGHSAGAHLALWLAARGRLPSASPLYSRTPLRLKGVVALAGPGDLRDFAGYAASICGAPVIHQLLGGAPEAVPERYAQASPRELLPLGVPQTLIVGTEDAVMPQRSREAYVQAARAAGDRADVLTVDGAGHHEPNAPTSAAWPVVRDAVLRQLGMPVPSKGPQRR